MIAIEYLAFITVLRHRTTRKLWRSPLCRYIAAGPPTDRYPAQRTYDVRRVSLCGDRGDFVRRVFVGGGEVRAGVSIQRRQEVWHVDVNGQELGQRGVHPNPTVVPSFSNGS
jgi:hypothetical protein